MNMRRFLTVSLCVGLSVSVNLLFLIIHREAHRTSIVEGTAFHLVDAQGRVRAELTLAGGESNRPEPTLAMLDESGKEAIVLGMDRYGEGVLVLNSTKRDLERPGVVVVGYLPGNDTNDFEDPLGAWGVGVRLSPGKTTSLGFSKTGRSISPSVQVR